VVVRDGQKLRVPWVCACCLGPSDGTDDGAFSGTSLSGSKRYKMTVPIPYCDGCRGTQRTLARMNTIAGAVLFALVWLVCALAGMSHVGRIGLGLVGFFGGAILSGFVLPGAIPALHAAGHVPGCKAVSGIVGAGEARLTFANRAFARIWRDLQAGIESKAPALAWAKIDVPARPVSAPPPANAEAERKLAGQALRDHARASSAPAGGGRHAAPGGKGFVAADALAGALRFALKECHFTEAGIEARLVDGSERRAAWTDIERVAVRQMPPGPPFGAAIILDLALHGGGVLRLLASTRGNFGALPGTGVTSQENFRRLAAHITSKHAGAAIEPESTPFLRESKAPPRFDTIGRFEAYDAQYG
jgi:hypothetical protein